MMKIIDCEQGTPEWFAARLGIPTASAFSTILSSNKEAKDKKTRTEYMRKLAGEIVTGEPMENYSNVHMERGKVQEDVVRVERDDDYIAGLSKAVDQFNAELTELVGQIMAFHAKEAA